MNRKAYIIIYTKGGVLDTFDYKAFHNSLTADKAIINWWHYIDNTYIIITANNVTATGVSSFIKELMPNKQFLVSELNLQNHNGWLPEDAWKWINTYKNG